MKLLIVNSNTSDRVSAQLCAAARACCSPGTHVETVSAAFGVPAIERPEDLPVATEATVDAFERCGAGMDAGIVGCFSDPGLAKSRRRAPFPIVGLAEAACLTAAGRRARFSIVMPGPAMVPTVRSLVREYGLEQWLAGVLALDVGVLNLGAAPQAYQTALAALITRSHERDGAEVAVLGGAVTAGLGHALAGISPIPVLDGLACAVALAESQAQGISTPLGSR